MSFFNCLMKSTNGRNVTSTKSGAGTQWKPSSLVTGLLWALTLPCRLSSPSISVVFRLLKEDIFLIDFGQSFLAGHPPSDNMPATPMHYLSPEAYFDKQLGFASDVWALACTIFEVRAGIPLFVPFLRYEHTILKQIVETLSRFPDPWWNQWEERHRWFDEAGAPIPEGKEGALSIDVERSLRQKLRGIGAHDAPDVEGTMFEKVGTRLDEAEVNLLADLLEKMLNYNPEDRIPMSEVVQHPWFMYDL